MFSFAFRTLLTYFWILCIEIGKLLETEVCINLSFSDKGNILTLTLDPVLLFCAYEPNLLLISLKISQYSSYKRLDKYLPVFYERIEVNDPVSLCVFYLAVLLVHWNPTGEIRSFVT